MIDDELRALISVDPTPGFSTRLRTRVASDVRMRHRRFLPQLAFAAAAVLSIASGALLWRDAAPDSRSAASSVPLEARAVAVGVWPAPPALAARPALPALGALPPAPALPARPVLAAIQFDDREARALRALFASTARRPLPDVPQPRTEPIIVPEIAIQPIADFDPEGAPR